MISEASITIWRPMRAWFQNQPTVSLVAADPTLVSLPKETSFRMTCLFWTPRKCLSTSSTELRNN